MESGVELKQELEVGLCGRAGEHPDLCAPGSSPLGLLLGVWAVCQRPFLADFWPPSPMPPQHHHSSWLIQPLGSTRLGEEDLRVLDLPYLIPLLSENLALQHLARSNPDAFSISSTFKSVFLVLHPEFLVAFSG